MINIAYVIIIVILSLLLCLSLSITLLYFLKNSYYFSEKEKEFINFTIDIYIEHFKDFGIQNKEQHDKLVIELNKIKNKLLVNKKLKK